MTLHSVSNRMKQLWTHRWWSQYILQSHKTPKSIYSPLLTEQEILDLRYRVEQDWSRLQQNQNIEHRTAGEIRSVYRGHGMDYDESRPYYPGDELRFMNWRVTARTGEPHMKVFREERMPAVFIVIDRRQSMRFGTRKRLKVTQAMRAAAVTAFIARLRNAPVAGVLLDYAQEHVPDTEPEPSLNWIAETSDEKGVFNFIHNANKPCPPGVFLQNSHQVEEGDKNSLSHIIRLLTPMLARGSHVVLISDFHDLDDQCRTSLMELSMTHQLKAIHIIDPAEKKIPACGSLLLQSDEKITTWFNSSDEKMMSEYQDAAVMHIESIMALFRSLDIHCDTLMTESDRIESLIKVW